MTQEMLPASVPEENDAPEALEERDSSEDIKVESSTQQLVLGHEVTSTQDMVNPTLSGKTREAFFKMNGRMRTEAAARKLREAKTSTIPAASAAFRETLPLIPEPMRSDMKDIENRLMRLRTTPTELDLRELMQAVLDGKAIAQKARPLLERNSEQQEALARFEQLLETYYQPVAAESVGAVSPFVMQDGPSSQRLSTTLRAAGLLLFGAVAGLGALGNMMTSEENRNWKPTLIYAGIAGLLAAGTSFLTDSKTDALVKNLSFVGPGQQFEQKILLPYSTHQAANRKAFAQMARMAAGNKSMESIANDPDKCRERLLAATEKKLPQLPPDVQAFLADDKAVTLFVSTLSRLQQQEAQNFMKQFFEDGMHPHLIAENGRKILEARDAAMT